LKKLELEQSIKLVSLIVSYFTSQLPTSDLIKYSLELLQLEAGIDSPIFLSDYSRFQLLYTEG